MIVLNFYEKFLLCVKWGRWESFGPKINILKLFSEYANNKLFVTFYLLTTIDKEDKI